MSFKLTLAAVLATVALALEIPPNIRNFYNEVKERHDCTNQLASGFYNSKFEEGDMSYCGDHIEDYGIVYLQGPRKLSNMDVDCDGVQGGPQDDGRCDFSETTIPQTAVSYIIQDLDVGIHDLNPHHHSFVVFGNSGTSEKEGWETFDPREWGVHKTSVMAVVCGDQMFFAVWGDSNGDDGDRPSVGEASISLATACFGKRMNGGDGDHSSHDIPDVLYIAFTGTDALPRAKGADWLAETFDEFHDSLTPLGNSLIGRIRPEEVECSWPGHCRSSPCEVSQDCADAMTCNNGRCG